MRKLLPIVILALMCNLSFSQSDTTAIFHNADSLLKLAKSVCKEKKYMESIDLYNQAIEMTKDVNNGVNDYYIRALAGLGNTYFSQKEYQKALGYVMQSAE